VGVAFHLLAALGDLGLRPAVPTLIRYLQHARRETVAAATTALGKLGDASSIEPLQRARARWGDAPLDVWLKREIDKALRRLSSEAHSEHSKDG
jgi:HEAT repeat protein